MRNVSEFWVIDFDRCIANVDTTYRLFERIIETMTDAVDVQALESARIEVESAGGSFDVLSYVKRFLAREEEYRTLLDTFLHEAAQVSDTLLEPGVHELFRYLEERSIPYGIVSYGHPDWQELKIAATGLRDIPHLIVNQNRKGEVLAAWRESDSFRIPRELTGVQDIMSASLVLVDDKAISFTGLPPEARGYWVRPAQLLLSQQGDVPDSVVAVGTLEEVARVEAARG